MALQLRKRQQDAIHRMLNLNVTRIVPIGEREAEETEVYKILVMDRHCFDVITPLVRVNELRRHGVTLHLRLDNERQPIHDVPAVYFVRPTAHNVARISADFAAGLYEAYHLNFSSSLPRPMLEDLAAGSVKANAAGKVAKVFDQYVDFVSLAEDIFSLAQKDAYVALNDPTAKDADVETAVAEVVKGLLSVCATLGRVPIIRCPRGGAAEMVAQQLTKQLRDHVDARGSMFSDDGYAGAGSLSLGSREERPILCIFERNFDLAAALQHAWTYAPLVHDVLDMRLNRVDITQGSSALDAAAGKKSYDLEDNDPFWRANADSQFPKVAEEVEAQLAAYKKAIAEVNAQTSLGDPSSDADMATNTQKLVSAVASLPELQERKKFIDKHTNIATALLGHIKNRGLDEYFALEEDLLAGKGDKTAVMGLLQATGRGTPEDKLRLAIIYAMTHSSGDDAMSPADAEALEGALRASGADAAALGFVQRMAKLNHNLLDYAERLYGQSLSAVAKGVKSLLASDRQLAVARATEALMSNEPDSRECAEYAWYDAKAKATSDGNPPVGAVGEGAPAHDHAIAFVMGGGNYLEAESVRAIAKGDDGAGGGGRAGDGGGRRSVAYGATEMLTGAEFVAQLGALGRKTGH
ncbi:predicted protein [Micromonas commoda]|uniref:SM/Sec1-family protein n=1 Tax=Micromonas commoda (strain RCC299 / NOUM17 / CCMP2709) TaxID=296587 RepID=C1DZA9_MICCC|nr:predicted protein [Micromonas commoda]ACO61084.1 predicted protein [Micromonas commoda]|eukprot:XP_002499826.1 predicted protein [Micromonas commoda]